jgi:hypothetical protein
MSKSPPTGRMFVLQQFFSFFFFFFFYRVEERQIKEQQYFQINGFCGVKTKLMKRVRFTGRRIELSVFIRVQPLVDFSPECYYPSYAY